MNKRKRSRRIFNNAFWHSFKYKYKLSISNESTLEEVASLNVSKRDGFFVFLTLALLLFVAAGLIMIYTPLRNYLPGYMSDGLRAQMVINALRIDSLKEVTDKQNLYIMNIQDIFQGTVRPDTAVNIETLTAIRQDSLLLRTEREMAFRRQYEETEKYNLTAINAEANMDGLLFEVPARGPVIAAFHGESRHYGIDIAATPQSAVQATLEGVVVLSTFSATEGYMIGIQHRQEFLSFYKQCGALYKKEGDTVKAGELIATVGAPANDEEEIAHLHFELWHKGRAVDPVDYIAF
ncbi:MAG: M23 family metallopeptidase [Prevotellaceae bacterium]|jgi:lipoprotein NlpD|nr:M23 family metallopeptidase [Prevotellaceae bacterium]